MNIETIGLILTLGATISIGLLSCKNSEATASEPVDNTSADIKAWT